jgi:UDP-N-acetylglucosamine 2-epimerase (non-hydrolysing)
MGVDVLHVVGARPNFMKAAPVHTALRGAGLSQAIVHTGQHYDSNMSDVFFGDLGLPRPDVNLEAGSGSHAVQTASIMMGLERTMLERRPRVVLVYGDVNSTMAGALVCAKLGVTVAHVEAGLRSFDRSMPEEINRIVTDRVADVLYTPSADGDENLLREGVSADKIGRVGNVMIDTLVRLMPAAESEWSATWSARCPERFGLVTLHRPSNVDEDETLGTLMAALATIARDLPLFFPVHPRTRARLERHGRGAVPTGVALMEPLGYLQFLALQRHATLVITDSGGVQEETTFLGVPCLTVRENTERPITVSLGTNVLVGRDCTRLVAEARAVITGGGKIGQVPPLWDGCAGSRIADDLRRRGL